MRKQVFSFSFSIPLQVGDYEYSGDGGASRPVFPVLS